MLFVLPLLPGLAGISLCWAFCRAALLLGSAGCPHGAQGDACSWQLGAGALGAWAAGTGKNLMEVGWEM